MFLIKDLDNPKIHYSVFLIDSTFDFHITLENEADSKKKHIQLIRMQIDWKFLIEKLVSEIRDNLNIIFQHVKINDPEWQAS